MDTFQSILEQTVKYTKAVEREMKEATAITQQMLFMEMAKLGALQGILQALCRIGSNMENDSLDNSRTGGR